MTIFAVIENAGTEDQHAVKFSRNIQLAIGWMYRHYSEAEIERLHIDVMLQREDGTFTTDF